MMVRMLAQLPLPLLPGSATEIAPGVGVVTGAEGGLVLVHGLATFAWDAGDEAGRRLAAVQLVRLRAAGQAQVAEAFGVDPVTVWRWDQALAGGGVAGLVPARKGPRRASKLTAEVVTAIRGLDGQGRTLAEIAAAAGVSVSSVRNALGRNPARPGGATGPATGEAAVAGEAADGTFGEPGAGAQDAGGVLPVLPDPMVRDGERAAARWGLLGEGAAPVFAPGARYPLAGLLLALPPLEAAGLLGCARQVYGGRRPRVYRPDATLLTLGFLALAGEPPAGGGAPVPPPAPGRGAGAGPGPGGNAIRRRLPPRA